MNFVKKIKKSLFIKNLLTKFTLISLTLTFKKTIMITEINFTEYVAILETAKKENEKIRLNVSTPQNIEGNRYFKSLEGCSILSAKGELCGLFRFKKGNEDVAKIHQNYRIKLGGYWLNCYKGVLDGIYQKNGFHTVSTLEFNPEFAPENWQNDKVLKNKPQILFMSLYKLENVNDCKLWDVAEITAIASNELKNN